MFFYSTAILGLIFCTWTVWVNLFILFCFLGKPKLLHFSPYSKDQIVKILSARLSEVYSPEHYLYITSVQFHENKNLCFHIINRINFDLPFQVEGANVLDVSAVQFCARKIAAVSGDIRKALDICRRAVEVVESEVKRQQILKPIERSK